MEIVSEFKVTHSVIVFMVGCATKACLMIFLADLTIFMHGD